MNVKAGLTRAWLMGSLAWALYCAWHSELACSLASIGFTVPGGQWCAFPVADPLTYYAGLAAKMVGLPLAVWLIGAAGNWILTGFRRPSRSS